jgi:hypothetical protein
MQKSTPQSKPAVKRPYETPKLITHGDVAKLTQKPWKPKDHGHWSGSDISLS